MHTGITTRSVAQAETPGYRRSLRDGVLQTTTEAVVGHSDSRRLKSCRYDRRNLSFLIISVLFFWVCAAWAAKAPPSVQDSASEPVKYVGKEQPDKWFYDGGLRHAIGVHLYEALRANRTCPPEGGLIGWTYNHQPYLAYWNNQFYLQYLSNIKEEHGAPGRTLVMTSPDGRVWSNPTVVFPEYVLPEIKCDGGEIVPAGTFSVMHQRMGFYTAPDGRLLTLGFYSYCIDPRHAPNKGQGLGRVVREIYKDFTFGPIYFIRYNRHAGWNETNTAYPFYKSSSDTAFVKACDDLLADKLMTLQWWEEDRATDGFYTPKLNGIEPKAFSWTHRPDGTVLGVWKAQLASLSSDEGKSWSPLVKCPTILECNAKTWVQRTADGLYALVYDHTATRRNRFPLVVMTSEDCCNFDGMLVLHGEVPPIRYQGLHKNLGPQYVRGIDEGNGQPPGKYLWNTYSMHKEDLWVSRTRLPVTGGVDRDVAEDFNSAKTEADLELWNLYMPRWAPVSVVQDPVDAQNRCLELRDEEPYDYASAERVFPKSRKVAVEFRILPQQIGNAPLDVEVQDQHGNRPLRLHFDSEWLALDIAKQSPDPLRLQRGKWLRLRLEIDCAAQKYSLAVNGKATREDVPFALPVELVERLLFRTGPWRGDVRSSVVDGQPASLGLDQEDLPGADHKVSASIFLVDDVKTMSEQR
jgi:hypothetical protein